MKRKLPADGKLIPLLEKYPNVEIAKKYGATSGAVSFHRKRLGVSCPERLHRCLTCGLSQPKVGFHRDASRKNGLSTYCKTCQVEKNRKYRHRNKEKFRVHSKWLYENHRNDYIDAAKRNYQNNKERHRRNKLKRTYGITIEQYDEILKAQNGVCAVCRKSASRVTSKHLFVDHDHKTGKVRGLLCGNCNSLLGHAKDSLVILKDAIHYLA
jgi:hypothetical protein